LNSPCPTIGAQESISTPEQFNNLIAFTALKGFAAIALSTVTWLFYEATVSVGFLNGMQPFSILNFGIFFMAGWFF
jgi:hypothetical protein